MPDGRVELIRATGEPACCKKWKVASQSGTFAALGEDAAGRPDVGVEEFPVRWGAASHGVLRVHTPAACGRPAIGAETRRRLTMACTLAACALENARLRAEWIWGGEHDGDEGRPDHPALGDDDRSRTPHERPDVVRDATFLNAVLPFALAQSRRYGEPVSLLCVQVDRLGAIRNMLGATLADRLVSDLASTVSAIVRASDIVARLDDDRIVALLVRARGDGAMGVARMIARTVADSGLGSPGLPGASISIGVAEFPSTARDAASLLDAADEAMVTARAGGSRSPVLAGPRPSPVQLIRLRDRDGRVARPVGLLVLRHRLSHLSQTAQGQCLAGEFGAAGAGASHSLRVLSSLPVAIVLPSGE